MTISEQYRAVTERAVIGAIADRRTIGVRGRDRASYLHGLLTNDVQALRPGAGCYAAWLTPQGRMVTDLHVLETGELILLDVPAGIAPAVLERLDHFLFSEDVQLSDMSDSARPVWIHGPSAPSILEAVLPGAAGLHSWDQYRHARLGFDRSSVLVARIDQLGVPGFCIYCEVRLAADLQHALEDAGAAPAAREAVEAARIAAGYPVFGIDMTEDTIPLEAGIEDRAISFTKGCYVGQEVIVRVLHRGHGRVARRLVGFRVEGEVASRGMTIVSDAREIGSVTSAARSPLSGSIAMGYVHRDFAAAGTRVELETTGGRVPAVVSAFPIRP